MPKYLVWSPVKGVQAQDLGSENDAVSVDDGGYEYLPIEGEYGQGEDVVLDSGYDHNGDGERPLYQLCSFIEQIRFGASIHSANLCTLWPVHSVMMFCFVFPWKFWLPIVNAVSAQQPAEHVKNTQQNITTEWIPHSVDSLM